MKPVRNGRGLAANSSLIEFSKALEKGGRRTIHHAKGGDSAGGWRSGMTAELVAGLISEPGLTSVNQFARWGDSRRFSVGAHNDVSSVFDK